MAFQGSGFEMEWGAEPAFGIEWINFKSRRQGKILLKEPGAVNLRTP